MILMNKRMLMIILDCMTMNLTLIISIIILVIVKMIIRNI